MANDRVIWQRVKSARDDAKCSFVLMAFSCARCGQSWEAHANSDGLTRNRHVPDLMLALSWRERESHRCVQFPLPLRAG